VARINRAESIQTLSLKNPLNEGCGQRLIQHRQISLSGAKEALSAPNMVEVNVRMDKALFNQSDEPT